jgi:RNase P/RNase MRP subunit p29
MITQQNIINHELIGLDARIIESTNKITIGLSGKITDETSAMLFLTKNGTKMISKKNNIWEFAIGENRFTVNGDTISKRPEDRIGIKA